MMASLLAFVTTVLALEVLRRNAKRLGLLSYPGAHRHHSQPTPLVGGIGIFIGVAVGLWLAPVADEVRLAMGVAGIILVLAGIWDDIVEISFGTRFVAQAVAVGVLAWVTDVSLRDLGYLVNAQDLVPLGRWGIALTIFAAVGVINAINMSDGLDGLAGGLTLIACGSLLIVSYMEGDARYVAFVSVLIAAVLAFMLYNARIPGLGAARLYLGNTGSLLIGFLLAWALIGTTQGTDRVMAPVTALWIFALPLFDAVAALLRRPIHGDSPFYADRSHYHHYLLDRGFSVNQTWLISLATAAVLAAAGLAAELNGVAEHRMFFAFLALFALYLGIMLYIDSTKGKRIRIFRSQD